MRNWFSDAKNSIVSGVKNFFTQTQEYDHYADEGEGPPSNPNEKWYQEETQSGDGVAQSQFEVNQVSYSDEQTQDKLPEKKSSVDLGSLAGVAEVTNEMKEAGGGPATTFSDNGLDGRSSQGIPNAAQPPSGRSTRSTML